MKLGAVAIVGLFAIGCGDDDTVDPGNDPRCASAAPGCLVRHEGCMFTDDAARCEACPPGEHPTLPNGECVAFGSTPMTHSFGPFTVAAGGEDRGVCESWVLGNTSDVFVNAIEVASDGGFHHSVLFYVPEAFNDWPTDRWVDCYENGFDEVTAALAGGVLLATSTEVDGEMQQFPAGVAMRIPPNSRIIAAMHLKNDGAQAVTTSLRTKLYTTAAADVTSRLAPSQMVIPGLEIPTDAPSTFTATCDLATAYSDLYDRPLSLKVRGFLPHIHPATTAFQVRVVGGPNDGQLLVDLGPYEPSTLGWVLDPPVDLAGATGLSLRCSYDHTLADDAGWGDGHEEKCETLIYVESDMAFAGVIGPGAEPPAPSPDGTRTWGCQALAFTYDAE